MTDTNQTSKQSLIADILAFLKTQHRAEEICRAMLEKWPGGAQYMGSEAEKAFNERVQLMARIESLPVETTAPLDFSRGGEAFHVLRILGNVQISAGKAAELLGAIQAGEKPELMPFEASEPVVEREAFEVFVRSISAAPGDGGAYNLTHIGKGGNYSADSRVMQMWWVWQARSRLAAESPVEPSGLSDERRLRRMLAFAYSGPGELYGDDGELQNGAELPIIDFNRDSVAEIESKITERGRRRLAKESAQETECDHPRSDLLARKGDAFEIRKCQDCTKIFRVRLPEKASPPQPAEGRAFGASVDPNPEKASGNCPTGDWPCEMAKQTTTTGTPPGHCIYCGRASS